MSTFVLGCFGSGIFAIVVAGAVAAGGNALSRQVLADSEKLARGSEDQALIVKS